MCDYCLFRLDSADYQVRHDFPPSRRRRGASKQEQLKAATFTDLSEWAGSCQDFVHLDEAPSKPQLPQMVTQPMSTPLILCTSHDGSVQGYILQFCLEIVTTLSLVHHNGVACICLPLNIVNIVTEEKERKLLILHRELLLFYHTKSARVCSHLFHLDVQLHNMYLPKDDDLAHSQHLIAVTVHVCPHVSNFRDMSKSTCRSMREQSQEKTPGV